MVSTKFAKILLFLLTPVSTFCWGPEELTLPDEWHLQIEQTLDIILGSSTEIIIWHSITNYGDNWESRNYDSDLMCVISAYNDHTPKRITTQQPSNNGSTTNKVSEFGVKKYSNGHKAVISVVVGEHFVFYVPKITRKNEDFFVFLGMSRTPFLSFLMSRALQEIKYKVGIDTLFPDVLHTTTIGPEGFQLMEINARKFSGLPDITRNGYGITLRVTASIGTPYLLDLAQNPRDKTFSLGRGVYKFCLEELAEYLNVSYDVFPATIGGDSGNIVNGSWTGVIGDLVNNRADFGTCSSANEARLKVTSFTGPLTYCVALFITGLPGKAYSWRAIYQPLSTGLWAAIGLSLGGVVVCLYCFQGINSTNREKSTGESLFSRHYMTYVTFALVGQGIEYPKMNYTRLICVIWLFSALILNTAYVSKLTVQLAFPVIPVQPKTFGDLVSPKFSNFRWGQDQSGGRLHALFKYAGNPVFKKIYEGMAPPSEVIDCIKRAISTDFACITWQGTEYYVAYRNLTLPGNAPIPLKVSEEVAMSVPTGIVMRKDSIYLSIFTRFLESSMETGRSGKWYLLDLEELRRSRKKRAVNYNTDSDVFLKLKNLMGTFYFIGIGWFVSVGAFVGEFCFTRANKVYREKFSVLPYS